MTDVAVPALPRRRHGRQDPRGGPVYYPRRGFVLHVIEMSASTGKGSIPLISQCSALPTEMRGSTTARNSSEQLVADEPSIPPRNAAAGFK
jgi:hypothetical protein